MEINQIVDNIKDISIFTDLNDIEIRKIADFCMSRTYPKGSMIILEEEFGDTVFGICEGTVKITRVNDEGKEVILSLMIFNFARIILTLKLRLTEKKLL